MPLIIDKVRWPRTASYAASLPNGLQSFTDCEVHAEAFEYLRQTHPELVKTVGLPDAVLQVLKGETPTQWIPEVVGNLIYLVARDQLFDSDAKYFEWSLASANATFTRPWIRFLLHVFSPTLIIMGVGGRWQAMHHGSQLSAEKAIRDGDHMKARGQLLFPAGLFNELLLKRIGVAFEAALAAAKAKNPHTDVVDITTSSACFRMTWEV